MESLQIKWAVTDDCMQLFYLEFLEYDNELLNKLDQNNQMRFYIVRWLKNQWFSETSRYHYQYRKWYEKYKPIDIIEGDQED